MTFGGTPASSFTVQSDTSIRAFSPARDAGRAKVSVTTPSGVTPANPAATFEYAEGQWTRTGSPQRLALRGAAGRTRRRRVLLASGIPNGQPFESVGGVVDWAPKVGYSLESQTRPMYWHVPSEATVVHEIAHMWFGDAVTPQRWSDIWLSEGFATWSEWICSERRGGASAGDTFAELYATAEGSEAGQDLWRVARAGRVVPHAGL